MRCFAATRNPAVTLLWRCWLVQATTQLHLSLPCDACSIEKARDMVRSGRILASVFQPASTTFPTIDKSGHASRTTTMTGVLRCATSIELVQGWGEDKYALLLHTISFSFTLTLYHQILLQRGYCFFQHLGRIVRLTRDCSFAVTRPD